MKYCDLAQARTAARIENLGFTRTRFDAPRTVRLVHLVKRDDRLVVPLCDQAGFHRLGCNQLITCHFVFGAQLSIVKDDQRITFLYDVPIVSQHVFNDTALKVLNRLTVSLHGDNTRGVSSAIEWR